MMEQCGLCLQNYGAMQTSPRKITEPFFFVLQNAGDFVLCPAKLWSNADFAPQNHGDIVSGACYNPKIKLDLYNPIDHFLRKKYFVSQYL